MKQEKQVIYLFSLKKPQDKNWIFLTSYVKIQLRHAPFQRLALSCAHREERVGRTKWFLFQKTKPLKRGRVVLSPAETGHVDKDSLIGWIKYHCRHANKCAVVKLNNAMMKVITASTKKNLVTPDIIADIQ